MLNSESAREHWDTIEQPTLHMLVMVVLVMQSKPEHRHGKDLSLWATKI